jgi:cytoskeletal protein CcmA (bactofilin family)
VSRQKTSDIVDGYTTMRAAQRAVTSKKQTGKPESEAKPKGQARPVPKEVTPSSASAGNMRIDHTAQPARHDIICYECGYGFLLTGKLKQTYCPKCRATLEAIEQTISGKWTGSITTIGEVRIEEDAVVTGGSVVAGTVVLSGCIEGGKVRAVSRLIMCGSAQFSKDTVDAAKIRIEKDASIHFHRKVHMGDVEVFGKLSARLTASGSIAVRAGGRFKGEIVGHHLVVDEGGGLNADLEITPGPDLGRKDRE